MNGLVNNVFLGIFASTCIIVSAIAEEIVVIESKFGVVVPSKERGRTFFRSKDVPSDENTGYGWLFRIENQKKPEVLTEVLSMPEPAVNIQANIAKSTLSKDRKSISTRINVDRGQEIIGNFWSVAPKDPLGPYSVKILQGKKLIAQFHFNLVDKPIRDVLMATLDAREGEYFQKYDEDDSQIDLSGTNDTLESCKRLSYDKFCLIKNASVGITESSGKLNRILEFYSRETTADAGKIITLAKQKKYDPKGSYEMDALIFASSYFAVNGDEVNAAVLRKQFVEELEKSIKANSFAGTADNLVQN